MYYKRAELAKRWTFFFSSGLVAGAFGGVSDTSSRLGLQEFFSPQRFDSDPTRNSIRSGFCCRGFDYLRIIFALLSTRPRETKSWHTNEFLAGSKDVDNLMIVVLIIF